MYIPRSFKKLGQNIETRGKFGNNSETSILTRLAKCAQAEGNSRLEHLALDNVSIFTPISLGGITEGTYGSSYFLFVNLFHVYFPSNL